VSKFEEDLTVLYAKNGESEVAIQRAHTIINNALDDGTGEFEIKHAMEMSERLADSLPDQVDKRLVAVMAENSLAEYLTRRGDRMQWTDAYLVAHVAKAKAKAMKDPLGVLFNWGGLVLTTVSKKGGLIPEINHGTSAEILAKVYAELGEFDDAQRLAEAINEHDEITSHNVINILSAVAVEQARRNIDPLPTIDKIQPLIQAMTPILVGEDNLHTNQKDIVLGQIALAQHLFRGDSGNFLNEARHIVYSMPNDGFFHKIESLVELAKVEVHILGSRTAGRTLKDAYNATNEVRDNLNPLSLIFLPRRQMEVADAAIETGNFDLALEILSHEYNFEKLDFPPTDTRGVDLRVPMFAKLGAEIMKATVYKV
jgi:hypothetical protein